MTECNIIGRADNPANYIEQHNQDASAHAALRDYVDTAVRNGTDGVSRAFRGEMIAAGTDSIELVFPFTPKAVLIAARVPSVISYAVFPLLYGSTSFTYWRGGNRTTGSLDWVENSVVIKSEISATGSVIIFLAIG